MLVFKTVRQKNYSIKALNLILKVENTLEAVQVKCCRTVNTGNHPGTSIPMDLHLEHLNQQLKTALRNIGSNVTDSSVILAAKSINVVNHVCSVFGSTTGHKPYSGLPII